MTKKQYLDKVYTTAHELLTLYRECFPEEMKIGSMSISVSDRYEGYPEMSSISICTHDENTHDVLQTYSVIHSEKTKHYPQTVNYYENEKVI